MESMQLTAELREASNKGAAREIRRNGKIPAVLYGEGDPKAVSVDAKDWATRFKHVSGNMIVTLKVAGAEHHVLIKDMQEDILSGRVNHIDFYAIHAGQKLHTQVPIHLEGTPMGVREGGILEQKIETLEIICLPKDLPSVFTVDVSKLAVGESIHVGALDIPDTVELRVDPTLTVAIVSHAKASADETGEGAEGVEEADAGVESAAGESAE